MHPILSSLGRHKLTVLLLVLEVTFTCAIVCNVAFMLARYAAPMEQPSGIKERGLLVIKSTSLDPENPVAEHEEDLAALREIPGVRSAAAIGALTFGDDFQVEIGSEHDRRRTISVSAFSGTSTELSTLGLDLIEGRNFLPDEYIPGKEAQLVPAVITTRSLANRLFPKEKALGKFIYYNDHPVQIVGIVDKLLRPRPKYSSGEENEHAILMPSIPDRDSVTYIIRVENDSDRILRLATNILSLRGAERIIDKATTFAQMREDFFRRDRIVLELLRLCRDPCGTRLPDAGLLGRLVGWNNSSHKHWV